MRGLPGCGRGEAPGADRPPGGGVTVPGHNGARARVRGVSRRPVGNGVGPAPGRVPGDVGHARLLSPRRGVGGGRITSRGGAIRWPSSSGAWGWGWTPPRSGSFVRPRRGVYVRRSIRPLLRPAPCWLRPAMGGGGSGVGGTPGGTMRGLGVPIEADMRPQPREARGPEDVIGMRGHGGHTQGAGKVEGHAVHPWMNPAQTPGGADGTGLAGAACRPRRRETPGVVLRCGGTGRALRRAGHAGAATRGTVHFLLACGRGGRHLMGRG